MNFFTKSSYSKTMGASLLLHGALLSCLMMMGPLHSANSHDITAVSVDIVPASIIDTGKTETAPSAVSVASATSNTPQTPAQQAAADKPVLQKKTAQAASSYTGYLPYAALPGEEGQASVAKLGTATTGTVEAVITGGGSQSGKSNAGEGEQINANCLYSPKPSYPLAARQAGWEGAVIVRLLIDKDGSVASVSIREGSGYTVFDESVLRTVRNWRFSPAKKDGIAITSFHDVKVWFRLVDA